MDGNHVVLDISSDEEVGFNWGSSDGCVADIDWNELFVNLQSGDGDDKNRDEGHDSDEVVVIGEVFAKPKRARKSSSAAKLAALDQDGDDDCVVLSGDPDKQVTEQQDYDCDSDDLVIVGERGQVACRDYPHPRHLCVKFPFDTGLHSDHCNLCHCFVCDSPAPCNFWGNGNSLIDHCHATDKEELWKSERKRTKEGKTAPLSNADDSFWRELLAQIPTTAPLPAIDTSFFFTKTPSFNPPNIIRAQRTLNHPGRNGYLPNPRHSNVQRAQSTGHHNPYLFPTPPISKRQHRRTFSASRSNNNNNKNNPFTGFRNGYFHHLSGINSASKPKQMLRPIPNGPPNVNTYHTSQTVHASQVSTIPAPSQAQSCPYPQPPILPVMPQSSHSFPTFLGETPLPPATYSENHSEHSLDPPDFPSIELDTQFLDPALVTEPEDGHPGFDMDNLWQLL